MKLLKILILAAFIGLAPLASAHAESPANAKEMPDAAAMEQAMKLAAPGEHHEVLKQYVGDWNYTSKMWMSPDAEPMESTGTSIDKMIMDGRYMQQEVTGTMEMNGQTIPFNGMGLIGYDNVKGEYSTLWIDNMSTTMMKGSATYDKDSNTMTDTGSYHCAMRGEEQKYRSEIKVVDDNTQTYTMYTVGEDGKEFKTMEIIYTRQ